MPARTDPFTTGRNLIFEAPMLPATVERAFVHPQFGLTLRRLNQAETSFSSAGKYRETVVELPNWSLEGLAELFSFDVLEAIEPFIEGQDPLDRARIGYQLSNDGGTTWLLWDDGSSAWVPAVGVLDGVYNDLDTVDKHIPAFPTLTLPRQIRIRVRLTPGASGRQRPLLRTTGICYESRLNLYEDVTRSLKRYVDGAIRLPKVFIAELTGGTSVTIPTSSSDPSVQPSELGYDVTVAEPITVYNLTTDPNRNQNLFGSLGGVGNRTITFLGAQTGKVEINFVGIPEVFIGAEEFFQLSKIPSVVITFDRLEQYGLIRTEQQAVEKSIARRVARIRPPRVPYLLFCSVRVQSSLKHEALLMKDALSRILDKGDVFTSVAIGDHYCVMSQTAQVAEDQVAKGLFVGNVTLKILGKVWLKAATEVPLVEKVVMQVGAEFTCNLNLPPHLRNVYREQMDVEAAPG